MADRPLPYTTHFAVVREDIPLITTGAVWDKDDAVSRGHVAGGDFVGVARAGIAHPDWPSYLVEEPSPTKPPFTPEWLAEAT